MHFKISELAIEHKMIVGSKTTVKHIYSVTTLENIFCMLVYNGNDVCFLNECCNKTGKKFFFLLEIEINV